MPTAHQSPTRPDQVLIIAGPAFGVNVSCMVREGDEERGSLPALDRYFTVLSGLWFQASSIV
jgi:hypothetical protein